jgi:hypothetical protein
MAAEYRNLSAFAPTNVENGSQGPRPDFVRANVQKAPVLWGYFRRPLMTSGAQTKAPPSEAEPFEAWEGRCPSAAPTLRRRGHFLDSFRD